jgi:hypothetical protein|tara:strand:- start:393 stop:587 length:195 start_codon:yes stop_codon:yes gene_type:complete
MSMLLILKEGRLLDIDSKGSAPIQESYPVEDAVPTSEVRSATFGMAMFGQSHFAKAVNAEDKVA